MADTCRSCGAAIVWVATPAGKRMPCDPKVIAIVPLTEKAHPNVTPVLSGVDTLGNVVRGLEATPDSPAAALEHIRIPHWGTCPTASQHRGRARG